MEANTNNITINPDDMPEDSPSAKWLRWIGRVLLPVISLTVSLQPIAFAAPSPSLLAQEPRFLDVSVESNVMFVMDDSLSMDDIRLPVPAAIFPNEPAGGNVTTRNGLVVERVNEWIFRTSTLNPLYYNPAITYTPWNDNGRAGASGNFTNASTTMVEDAIFFREGLVPHDMRYAGPNYTYSGFNGSRRLTTRGANPPAVPGYLSASRPADGGFTGTVDSGRNQDIFSSPFVFVTNLTQICSSGAVSPSSTPQPTQARTDSAQPSTTRTLSAQPTSSRTNSAQPSTGRTITTQPSTPRASLPQPFTPRTTSAQPSTSRTSSAQPSTPRATSAQPSTARSSVAATSTARPTEYRIETGACGNWSAWTVMASPPSGLCSDPNSEGGVRSALVESRLQACPSGTATSGSNCLSCSSGYTLSGTQCVSDCPSGTVGSNATTCYSACPAGTTQTSLGSCLANCPASSPGSTATVCYQNCPAGTTQSPLGTCLSNCPGGTVGSTATTCYSACPAGTSQVSLGTCRTTCPGGTVGSTATACYSACPAGYSQSPLGTCVQNCPGGTVGSTATACYLACPAGTTQTSLGTCASNCPGGTVGSNATTCFQACPAGSTQSTLGNCRSNCPSGTLSSDANTCYLSCPAGSTLSGSQCLSDCPAGTVGSTSTACYSACPAGTSQASLGVCRSDCPANTVSSNATTCYLQCPSGTLSGGTCNSCPAGTSPFGTGQCCQTTSTTGVGCPYVDQTRCTMANRFYPESDTKPAPARYFVFVPVDNTRAPTAAELSDPANYERREINRDAPRYQATFDKPFKNNDPTQGRADRLDCGAGTTCTWALEAQNFANWYTYYRTRLFSAVSVSAQSLSALTRASGLDNLRLGYGSINYFPNGFNPYPNFNSFSNTPFGGSFTLDGQPSDGHIVRGVRPVTEVSPPPAPGSNDRRQETFDWLFSLRAIASTPNREALDAVGRYFTRTDNQGPWIQPSSPSAWTSTEAAAEHVSCRRNYAILITDGEWTNAPETFGSGQQQPVLGGSQRTGAAPATLAAQGGSPLDALTTTGPTHTRTGSGTPPTYQYVPASEPQFSGGAGSTTRTLSDAVFYYWSRDLRPDLENNIKPLTGTPDIAFWQHMTPFIVGYGISASRDTAATRAAINAGMAITWDPVRLENRPTEDPRTIVTDRDPAQSPPAAATPATLLTCNYDPITNPSGCGRVDDTLRAAMAARGDFLVATDVGGLATNIAAAFARIGEVEGAATAFTGRSASIVTGDRLYSASFITNRWTGKVEAFDAVALNTAFQNGTPAPSSILSSNFPTAGARNVFTSTAVGASGTSFVWANLTAVQQTALGNAAVLNYLRGDQSAEARNGGSFRNRGPGEIMGDIVNSNPIFSKATDARYNSFRQPAASGLAGPPPTNAAVNYPAFVESNRTSRPAAIYVGSNSGMLHAFNASDLSERFAYVPRAVYGQLPNLTAPGYVHRYYVDGPVVEGDVYINGAWRTVVVGTTGAGPKGVFALDVTQRTGTTPQDFSAGDVLWDITGADTALSNIAELGNITQPGVIGSGKDGEWYYFTGNGWESGNDKARLLAIRIRDGAILSIATDNVGGANPASVPLVNRPNGLGGVTPVYDGNRNVVGIYAGDRLGRLWKFDLSSTNPASWTVATGVPLFIAEDGSANRQPITAAPRVMGHPLGGRLIGFGTGRLTEGADIASTAIQSIYAVWEKNPNAPVAVSRSSLRQFTFSETGTAAARDRLRTLNGVSSLNWGTDNGWRVDLLVGSSQTGERVFASPIEQAGFLNVTSFEPIAGGDRCKGGGASFFYRFDVAGNFTRSGIRAPGGAVRPPDVVGSEFLGTVGGLRIFGRAADKTASNLSVLDKSELKTMLGSPKKSAATDSCAASGPGGISVPNLATGGALAPCPSQAQRVWRELPRGRR